MGERLNNTKKRNTPGLYSENQSEPPIIAQQCFNQTPLYLVEYPMVDLNVANTLKRKQQHKT